MNTREQLIAIADWLGDEEEYLSFGLRNAFDALRLYDYALARPELMCGYVTEWPEADRIAALGYDPMPRSKPSRDAKSMRQEPPKSAQCWHARATCSTQLPL
jgi:hypothetical protein